MSPQECARFINEAGWSGKLGGKLPTELWVEKVNSDCTAQVTYVWGDTPDGRFAGGFERVTIAKKALISFSFGDGDGQVNFYVTLDDTGEKLLAMREALFNNQKVKSHAILQKGH